jgi:hypothetical protein
MKKNQQSKWAAWQTLGTETFTKVEKAAPVKSEPAKKEAEVPPVKEEVPVFNLELLPTAQVEPTTTTKTTDKKIKKTDGAES